MSDTVPVTSKLRVQKSPDGSAYIDVSSIPMVKLTLEDFDTEWSKKKETHRQGNFCYTYYLAIYLWVSLDKKSSKKHRRRKERSPSPERPVIMTGPGEMPEDAELSDNDLEATTSTFYASKKTTRHALLNDDGEALKNIDLAVKPKATRSVRSSVVKIYFIYQCTFLET
jgi:hypothetical protein